MKYFVILIFFQFVRLICGHQFDASANVSDASGEKNVIQKRFGLLKYLFGFGASDDNIGTTVIIDRRFKTPKRRRRLRKCFPRGRRYRRPIYTPVIGRRNFDLTPRYIGTLPAFKQPPEDIFYYTFPNGLLDGDRNIDMYEPAPGDLLYPPMTPKISEKTKFNLHPKTANPELHPFYEHEAINLLPAPKTSNDLNHFYLQDDEINTEPFLNHNVVVPPIYKNTIVTPSAIDWNNILTLSKLINDRRKKTIHQQQHPQQNSQENLINNLKSSRGNNTVIPLKRTYNPNTTILTEPHQSNYHYYPATKLFKNPLNSSNHDRVVTSHNKNVKLMITSDGDRNTKSTRDDHEHDHHYYDTYNLQNTHPRDRTRLLYTIDDKIGVHDDHPMNMMDQVNDEGNYLKIYNIEPNYNWVNVDTKTVLGDKTPTPHKYSSSIPATENPLKANSIIGERTKIY